MGKYQVFQKVQIPGTESWCYLSSFTEAERRILGDDEDAVFALLAAHIHDVDEPKTRLFKSVDEMFAELSVGQLTDLVDVLMEISGGRTAERFPDGEGEAGGAESPQPE